MIKKFLKDSLGWGLILWLLGYILGIILFPIAPTNLIGWLIMPIGMVFTFWVLIKKIKGQSWQYYLAVAVVWTLIAVIFDYFFLVQMFKPADGYYKLDVYLYYLLTFLMPLLIGWFKMSAKTTKII